MHQLEALEGRPHVVFQLGISRGELFDRRAPGLARPGQVGFDRLAHALVVVAGIEQAIRIRGLVVSALNHR